MIRKLHQRYFDDPTATDVITFPDDGRLDVVISLDRARRQARERNVSLWAEVVLLMLHGILHGIGFDDLTKQKWCSMKQQEFVWVAKIL